MSAPIIEHKAEPDAQDDSTHPIPSLAVVDVMSVKKDGGADLFVVAASPLMADARSQSRLLAKLHGYLGFIASGAFRSQAGVPTPANTAIVVKLHPGSAPEIRGLLARSESWVLSHQASLRVQTLSPSELGVGT